MTYLNVCHLPFKFSLQMTFIYDIQLFYVIKLLYVIIRMSLKAIILAVRSNFLLLVLKIGGEMHACIHVIIL